MIDIGSATVGMTVAGILRRKMKITMTTRASARIRENRTSATDSRMVVDRSYITLMLTPAGTSARKVGKDRKSTRLNSSHQIISYAVFCLKKKKNAETTNTGR